MASRFGNHAQFIPGIGFLFNATGHAQQEERRTNAGHSWFRAMLHGSYSSAYNSPKLYDRTTELPSHYQPAVVSPVYGHQANASFAYGYQANVSPAFSQTHSPVPCNTQTYTVRP